MAKPTNSHGHKSKPNLKINKQINKLGSANMARPTNVVKLFNQKDHQVEAWIEVGD